MRCKAFQKNMRPPACRLTAYLPFWGHSAFLQFVFFCNLYFFTIPMFSAVCPFAQKFAVVCPIALCDGVYLQFLPYRPASEGGLHRIFLAKCEKILLENSHLCYNKYVMGRVMALDVGDVRIGVAVSDLMGIIANPLETYTRKGDVAKDAIYIANLAKQHEVDLFVSGLPLGLNGKENEQTQKTRAFIEELQKHTEIPVRFMDERFTTLSAERVLIEGNVRRENRKKVIDKVAATIILQNYLDSKR